MFKMTKRIGLLLMMLVLICVGFCSCGGSGDAEAIASACEQADAAVELLDENSEFDVSGYYVGSEASYLVVYECKDAAQLKTVNGWDKKEAEEVLGAGQKEIAPYFEGLKVDVFSTAVDEDFNTLMTFVEDGLVLDERE